MMARTVTRSEDTMLGYPSPDNKLTIIEILLEKEGCIIEI